jgi:hypothetical protein
MERERERERERMRGSHLLMSGKITRASVSHLETNHNYQSRYGDEHEHWRVIITLLTPAYGTLNRVISYPLLLNSVARILE